MNTGPLLPGGKGDFYLVYEPGKILGDGISSVVRQCVHKESGEEYAVKIIDKFSKDGEVKKGVDIITQVYNEVNALSKLKLHPSIITLIDFYENSAFLFLVFELAANGELFDYLTREVTIPEKICKRIMWQLLQSVNYIHSQNFVHRDIKPENILLDAELNLLISDFGFAINIVHNEPLFEVLGTPSYFAPETLNCVAYPDTAKGYGKPVDVWACGVILYTLLVGQGPFWDRNDLKMYRKIMEGKYNLGNREWSDISKGPKDLIKKILVVDTSSRLTASEALLHPWFEGMVPCLRCCIFQDISISERVKLKISFRTIALTILTLKKLYMDFHKQYVPMTFKSALIEPYGFKNLRKIVDGCAFAMYGHWVKRTTSHAQDRDALFENNLKRDFVGAESSKLQLLDNVYSNKLTGTSFLPRNSSFSLLNNNHDKCNVSLLQMEKMI